jgi:hypothetical protein
VSHARAVLAELLTVLRADLGTYDLSTVTGTPRVVIADGGPPQCAPPYVLIAAPVLRSTYDANLAEYLVRGEIEWWGYVAPTTSDTEARTYAALDLASEVVSAIETAHADPARTTLHTLTTLLPDLVEVFGDGPEVPPGCGIVHGILTYTAVRTVGV